MSKTTHNVQAKRVIFDSSLSFDEVTARLDRELSRDKAGPKVFELLRTATSRSELERGLQEITGGKDFAWAIYSYISSRIDNFAPRLFAAMPFHNWRNAYYDHAAPVPRMTRYILGNPLVAETMIVHDPYVPLNVPPTILVLENPDKSGTQVVYYLPSSVIAVSATGYVKAELRTAAEALDEKLEALVKRSTT